MEYQTGMEFKKILCIESLKSRLQWTILILPERESFFIYFHQLFMRHVENSFRAEILLMNIDQPLFGLNVVHFV